MAICKILRQILVTAKVAFRNCNVNESQPVTGLHKILRYQRPSYLESVGERISRVCSQLRVNSFESKSSWGIIRSAPVDWMLPKPLDSAGVFNINIKIFKQEKT